MNIKNISVQLLKVGFLSALVVLLLVGAISYSLKNKNAEKVYAGTGENVSGSAWSENIGWISFNNTSGGGGTNYGVNIAEDSGVGKLSGYAWSENIGWITFERSIAGTPPNNDVGVPYGVLAYIDSGNKLQGWARATAACDNNGDGDCVDSGSGEGVGAGANSGGWDGWIRFNDNNKYGITSNPANGEFSGWAWGSDNIGWISFNNSTGTGSVPYKVATTFELNQTPNAPSELNIEPNADSYCSSGTILFKWKFTDPNVNSPQNQQSKYKIEASYNAGGPFSIVKEENLVKNNNEIASVLVPLSEIRSDLGGNWYNQTLYWKVTVWDNGVTPKQSPTTSKSYDFPNNEYSVNFTSNPIFAEIHADQDIEFSDTSICYNSLSQSGAPLNTNPPTCGSRLWNFSSNAIPTTSPLARPIVKFLKNISTSVTLTYTDTDKYGATYSCSNSKSIGIKLSIPKFEEKK